MLLTTRAEKNVLIRVGVAQEISENQVQPLSHSIPKRERKHLILLWGEEHQISIARPLWALTCDWLMLRERRELLILIATQTHSAVDSKQSFGVISQICYDAQENSLKWVKQFAEASSDDASNYRRNHSLFDVFKSHAQSSSSSFHWFSLQAAYKIYCATCCSDWQKN